MPARTPKAPPARLKIEVRSVAALLRDPANARMHPRANIEAIQASIRRFDLQKPIVVDRKDIVIAGNGTLEAAEAEGWEWIEVIVSQLDGPEARAYAITDNRTAELAEWDIDQLVKTFDTLPTDLLAVTGFTAEEIKELLDSIDGPGGGGAGHTDPDDIPDAPAKPKSKLGDVWLLGEHRLMCGDSTDPAQIKQLCGDLVPTLIHADPPYGMGKEADGVLNDNLHRADLLDFQIAWWNAWATVLDDAASVYIWGQPVDLWRLWWQYLGKSGDLVFRNELVWFKQAGIGQTTPRHNYPTATERCLFLMRGEQFLGNQNKDDYWEGYEPLRAWLAAEVKRAGWTSKDVNELTESSMAGHWLTKSQFAPIPERHYRTLQAAAKGNAFGLSYDELFTAMFPDLRAGGNAYRRDLAEQMRATRTFHDNEHDNMNDVWQFSRVTGEERHGHATPKPVALVERVLKTSTREGGIVAVPFAGSGPEFIAATRLGRVALGMELSPQYVDVICRRFQEFTGTTPVNAKTGKTVSFT